MYCGQNKARLRRGQLHGLHGRIFSGPGQDGLLRPGRVGGVLQTR